MRLPSIAGILAVLAVLLATGVSGLHAENDDVLRYPGSRGSLFGAPSQGQPRRQQTVQPYGSGYPGPRGPAQPYAGTRYPGQVDPYYDPRRDPRYAAPERRAAPRPPAARATARRQAPAAAQPAGEPKKQEAKVEITTRIAVFGDSLADLVADGLSDAFEDAAEVEVTSEAKANSGLARTDVQDWPKAIRDYIAANDKLSVGVMMVGVNDRQPIREGDETHEPLSDRWRQLYGDRVDAVAAAFNERKLPFVWIGAPPVRSERLSADLIAINDIIRERVQRAGGVYVDIWPGFVDDENRYTPTGPDHRGQTARLRSGDGVLLTSAGARTAAEFAVTELKRIIERKRFDAPAVAASPETDPAAQQAAIDRMIDGAVQPLLEQGQVAALPQRPLAGPVVPLTRPEVAPGGVLISARPAFDADTAALNRRALDQGIPLPSRPGRADDFRWPR
ncbi:SGNH/GDSL hydrolase family protein [Salinarimonas soli]|uniref:DUF459 domain-containing protein n=1 Tax=Salinarimonas soli TaxID=1638099 RepID=A0A5B2VD42_9HYPH|nr:SGNH family hydrolase [Salinarimonas soli]KAA2236675.1 DUF459 domain-containing protein [Salinarimonas soli]